MPLPLSFLSGIVLYFSSHYFPFLSLILFLSGAVYLTGKKQGLLVLVMVCAVFYAFFRIPAPADHPLPFDRNIRVTGRFMPEADPLAAPSHSRGFLVEQASDEQTGDEIDEIEEQKIRLKADDTFDPDDEYELLLHIGKDGSRQNPGGVARQAVHAQVIEVLDRKEQAGGLFSRSRNALYSYIQGRFSRDSADFISAVTIGIVHFDEEMKAAFSITGLAHILSISGTHFGIFSVVVFAVFVFIIKRLPYKYLQRLTLYMTPSQAAAVLCLPLMIFYLGLSGGSIPALRSFIMIAFFLFGLLIGRKGFWLNTVLLAAFLLALWDPAVVLELSFQLSFMAVLFIGYVVKRKEEDEKTEDMKKETGSRIAEFLKGTLRLTFAAAIGTAPLVAYHFHYFSLISPVANLLAAPLIGFVVIPLALVSSFSYLLTGYYIFAPLVSIMTDLSLKLVRTMSTAPFADIRVPAFPAGLLILCYAGFLPYLLLGRKRQLLALPVLPFVVYAVITISAADPLSVTFLDVGQGDSAVVELPDNKLIVIDAGRTGRETAQFLKYLGRRSIDALVLTHTHPDHTGGNETLLGQFRVKELWDNSRTEYPDGFPMPSVHRGLERGDMLEGKGYSISILHPYTEFYTLEEDDFIEENNASLVLKVAGMKNSFLFLGDVEDEAEENLLHLGGWIKSEVLKIPHHGGRSSAHEGFLYEAAPAVAVISVGRDNSFGHPSKEMLNALSEKQVYRTDRDGAVKITETENGLKVKTFHDSSMEKADGFRKELRNLKRLFESW